MAKKRGSYKCGSCGESGHNARKCPKKDETQPAPKSDSKAEENPEPVVEVEEQPGAVALHTNQDIAINYNKEDARPARPPAPFECPVCLRVGILALLEVSGGKKIMRCEHCYTKANPTKILKWGALPSEKPADAPGYIGRWGVQSKPADAF